jgi:hypothetical protein
MMTNPAMSSIRFLDLTLLSVIHQLSVSRIGKEKITPSSDFYSNVFCFNISFFEITSFGAAGFDGRTTAWATFYVKTDVEGRSPD